MWMLAMHMSGNAGHLFTDIALMVIGKAVKRWYFGEL